MVGEVKGNADFCEGCLAMQRRRKQEEERQRKERGNDNGEKNWGRGWG